MIELAKEQEKVILVGVSLPGQEDTGQLLDELAFLADTAGAREVGRVIQSRDQIHPGTYVGTGKIMEIKDLLWETDASGIICDDELSPAQMKNLQDELEVKVLDRTLLILDIFAARARTSEGKIQVELAQLKYRQTRLAGFGTALSRLGGGIGTRGPGEKKLEMDRRLIRERIGQLNRELEGGPAAPAGYPGAADGKPASGGGHRRIYQCGKVHPSQYRLIGAGILAEDKLFATLDPTTRNLKPAGRPGDPADRYGGIYPQASPSSDRGLPEYPGGSPLRGSDHPYGGCSQSPGGGSDAHRLRDAPGVGCGG